MSETDLKVVCKSCGAEVSPYVTECPYCGARVRKRAPDLESNSEGGFAPKLSRREKRREKKSRQRATRTPRIAVSQTRPWATFALIVIPVVALLVRIALGNGLEDFGGVVAPLDSGWWTMVTAPFAYLSVGYLFAVGLALAIFAPGLERRFGTVATLILLVACGALGALVAAAVADQRDQLTVIAGGNGIALGAIGAWYMMMRAESKGNGESIETAAVVVAAAVILLLPVVVPSADFWAGLVGGLVGVVAGFTASRFTGSRAR